MDMAVCQRDRTVGRPRCLSERRNGDVMLLICCAFGNDRAICPTVPESVRLRCEKASHLGDDDQPWDTSTTSNRLAGSSQLLVTFEALQ